MSSSSTATDSTVSAAKESVVSTLAGTGEYKFFDNKATSAAFKSVYGVALDAARGLLYVADRDDNRLRIVNLADGSTSTLAGTGENGYLDNAIGTKAKFNCPNGLAFDSDKQLLYVADQKNYCIRAVHTVSGATTTIAGSQKAGSSDGKGAAASFSFPSGLALDSKQQLLYVSDQSVATVRVINLADGTVTTIAGDKNETESRHRDGKGLNAVFGAPVGLGLDTQRQLLFVADRWGNRLRVINLDKSHADGYGAVTTVAGAAEAGCVDGKGAGVRFDSPNGLAVDIAKGLVYVADNQNHKIRVVNIADGSTATLAGSGKKGFADGKASSSAFNWPKGLALDSQKQLLYVTDQDNHRVRVIDISPVLTYSTATGAATAAAANSSAATSTSTAPAVTAGGDVASGLLALAQLKREGLLTDDEFSRAKAKLLA